MNYLTNKIKTPDGTILQSHTRHEYVTHLDDNGEIYMVDGGLEYLRRNVNKIPFEELSIKLPQEHSVIRENLRWGTCGKLGLDEFKRLFIYEMETDHILAILDNMSDDLYKLYFDAFTNELIYRGIVP